jgi:hypothetical protein
MYSYLSLHKAVSSLLLLVTFGAGLSGDSSRRRVLLMLVILAGCLNAGVLHLINCSPLPSDFGHYYLGSKYQIPHRDFYPLLASVKRVFPDFTTPGKRRAEALRLFQKHHIPLPGLSSTTAELETFFRERGGFELEAASLAESTGVGRERVSALAADARQVFIHFRDAGFNASPLYILLRQLDWTLYPPLSRLAFAWYLLVQLAGLVVVGLFFQKALGWEGEDVWLFLAVMLSHWDYVGWTLTGLVGWGWLLPIALALWGMKNAWPRFTGGMLALAVGIKLFPALMALPLALLVFGRRTIACSEEHCRFAERVLLWFFLATLVLVVVSMTLNVSWTSFIDKIVEQFHEGRFAVNSYGLANLYQAAGVFSSTWVGYVRLLLLAGLLWAFRTIGRSDSGRDIPLMCLTSLCAVGLIMNMLNYYSAIFIPAIVSQRRGSPVFFSCCLVIMALTGLLPDFSEFGEVGWLAQVQLLGKGLFLSILPLVLLWRNLPPAVRADRSCWRGIMIGMMCLGLVIGGELWWQWRFRTEFQEIDRRERQNGTIAALNAAEELNRCFPRRLPMLVKLGDLLEKQGLKTKARNQYRAAMALFPDDVDAPNNLGVSLAITGELKEAGVLFRKVLEREPWRSQTHQNLARVLRKLGAGVEAGRHEQLAVFFGAAEK